MQAWKDFNRAWSQPIYSCCTHGDCKSIGDTVNVTFAISNIQNYLMYREGYWMSEQASKIE